MALYKSGFPLQALFPGCKVQVSLYQGNSTSNCTLVWGGQNISSVVRSNVGQHTVTLRDAGVNKPAIICFANLAAAGFVHCGVNNYAVSSGVGTFDIDCVDEANSAVELGTTDYLVIAVIWAESSVA